MTVEVNHSISHEDRLLLGEGLFETIGVMDGLPCHAELHWQRLCRSAQAIGIDFDISLESWQKLLKDWLCQHGPETGGMKVILSAGKSARGLSARGNKPYVTLHSFQFEPNPHPVTLLSSAWKRDAANPIYHYKTVNYLEAIMARRQAEKQLAYDALFFNTAGHITETSTANIFLIVNDIIKTPPLSDGLLPGITRQRILNCCVEKRFFCSETSLVQDDLQQADAVFLSSSLQIVQQVAAVDEYQYACQHPLVDDIRNYLLLSS